MAVKQGPIVLLAAPGAPTNIVYHALASEFEIEHVLVERPVAKRQLIRGRIRRLGLPTVAGQLVFQGLLVPLLRRQSSARLVEIRERHGLNASAIPSAIVHPVRSANAPETLELLRGLRPSMVIVQGTRILSRALLSSVPCPFINMHAGLTPLFRGVHGGYWAAATGKPELGGVTVHLVDPGVDTGGILYQARVPFEREDSFVTYPELQLAYGLPLMKKAIGDTLAGRLKVQAPPAGESRAWSHPTVWGYLWRRMSRGVR